ncbi:DNA-binding protein SMUBP-2 [Orbilia oligospora]|uniref:DNA-binding protein SMUBP-2 n=1 Tax=Orbilia oligospora TaxID=2813651 RepID=A0A7C8RGY3_ORBOL|nr:DNA-binding protein SMUBP-2 [Orbilia oligospora]KAF3307818.1 DNA-binding protein SMUBP-2 [Orbilia oligospora]
MDKSYLSIDTAKRLRVVKVANDAPFKRMMQTFLDLKSKQPEDLPSIIKIAFGLAAYFPPVKSEIRLDFFDEQLNEVQKEAVSFALEATDLALIHGPPGTGKTQTLIEIIRQLVARDLKILVCGPSNISVDNIADKLGPFRIPMVRIGHPARLLPSVISTSLDVAIKYSSGGMLVNDIRKEMDEKLNTSKKTRNGTERRKLWEDIRDLRKECKVRERRCTEDIVRASKIVLSTLHGAGGRDIIRQNFDVVIIDEAGQALEAQSLIPLARGPSKCILAGDHLQLPPTIPRTDKTSSLRKLELSLFERLIKLHGPLIKRTLSVQYRMHEMIMKYPSIGLYDSLLLADVSVRSHLLSDLPNVIKTDETQEPLVFWDTNPHGGFGEDDTGAHESKSNAMEAALCRYHLRNLLEAGVQPKDIAIITPYNAQVALLSGLIKSEFPDAFSEIEIGSVDGFQGREKEAILLSLVRSNEKKEVGFLADERRLNVAMTRPRRHLCVIGDSGTVARGSVFLKGWMDFLEENADLRYPDTIMLQQ